MPEFTGTGYFLVVGDGYGWNPGVFRFIDGR